MFMYVLTMPNYLTKNNCVLETHHWSDNFESWMNDFQKIHFSSWRPWNWKKYANDDLVGAVFIHKFLDPDANFNILN